MEIFHLLLCFSDDIPGDWFGSIFAFAKKNFFFVCSEKQVDLELVLASFKQRAVIKDFIINFKRPGNDVMVFQAETLECKAKPCIPFGQDFRFEDVAAL